MLAPEDETDEDVQVRRCDLEKIQRFATLNARAQQLRQEMEAKKKELEHLDDASTELMMTSSGDKILVLLGGETFFEQSEDAATEYCEELVETSQEQLSHCQDELQTLQKEQQVLKQELNARFGKSINLEE